MKVIIAGCRSGIAREPVSAAVMSARSEWGWPTITEIVSGGASGVDLHGEALAAADHIPVKRFPADWDEHGRAAGPIRNRQMAEYADALIAVWDGVSRGTKNMIEEATKRGLKVYVHNITEEK